MSNQVYLKLRRKCTSQGLQRTSDSTRNSATMAQLLWLHEAERVVDDAICRPDDTTGRFLMILLLGS